MARPVIWTGAVWKPRRSLCPSEPGACHPSYDWLFRNRHAEIERRSSKKSPRAQPTIRGMNEPITAMPISTP